MIISCVQLHKYNVLEATSVFARPRRGVCSSAVEPYFVSIASYRALLNLSKSSRRERSMRLSCTFIYAMPRGAGRVPAAYENSSFVDVIVLEQTTP